jgi:hypothetical protein
MLLQLIAGTLLIGATVAVHGLFMVAYLWRMQRTKPTPRSFPNMILILARLAVWCVFAHVLEILIWAIFYVGAGVMPDLETAGYFSAVTYATIGYGDITPPEEWRLLASMEGLIGILMCAWSGGFIFAVVSRLLVSDARSAS